MPKTAPQSEARAPGPARRSGVVVPNRATWQQRAVAALVFGLIKVVAASLRFHVHDRTIIDEQRAIVFPD